MIQTAQWLAQIALKSGLNEATCKQLWKLLIELLGNRLTAGATTTIEGLFTLSPQKELEYVALLPNGERLLVPPHIEIAASTFSRGQSANSITKLLIETADATPEAVHSFMQTMGTLFREHILKKHELELEQLGCFTPNEEGTGFNYTPALELINKVNKPFKSFPVTHLPEGKTWEDIVERAIPSEDFLHTPVTHTLLWDTPEAEQEGNTEDQLQEEAETPSTAPQATRHLQEETATVAPEGTDTTPPPLPSLPPLPNASESLEKMDSTIPLHTTEEIAMGKELSPTTTSVEEKASPMKTQQRVWLYAFIGMFIIAGGVLLLYQWLAPSPHKVEPKISSHQEKVVAVSIDSAQTTVFSSPDTISTSPSEPAIKPIEEQYIEIERGKRLVDYARKTYGNKKFWIYIYIANKSIIRNPDNISIGTRLRLPAAQEYNINAADSLSVQRADSLIRAYHNGKL
ncbi:hypothetical protein [Porphyromonas circumdentaria]|uniref:hypothetical protein n=1 Tax=Porphyromonas circumdentaria TaxID=29524 RepID=UPI0026DB7A97|nr:hypothetical protein [Porphyromonas circumdentaria]MDO4722181.1 hypothetical protein [Porphyromonas circumdentaria]